MTKKGGIVQIQIDVESDDDWEKLVARPGLIVVDIYSEWCGPCTGMIGNLRKIKLEIGGDVLTLAIAKSDKITCLERFRNKSEPTWMFIANGRMLRLIFGINAPRLLAIIAEEVKKEKQAIADETPRTGIDFDQLTDVEQVRADAEKQIADEAERAEIEAKIKAIHDRRVAVADNLIENIKDVSMVLFFPHVIHDQMLEAVVAFQETPVSISKPAHHHLNKAEIEEMLYFSEFKLGEEALEYLESETTTAYLVQAPAVDFDLDHLIPTVISTLYGITHVPPGAEESLARKMVLIVEKELSIIEIEEEEDKEKEKETELEKEKEKAKDKGKGKGEKRKSKPSEDILKDSKGKEKKSLPKEPSKLPLVKSSKMGIEEPPEEEDFVIREIKQIEIPGMWTPDNERTKALCMRIFFPNLTSKFDLPEPEVIPPHLVVAFDAFKRDEVLALASEFPAETMKLGFFTSSDPEKTQLVCKTVQQYNSMVPPVLAKLVIQVSKKKSEPLLSYSLLGPTYVSPNTVVGEKESALFFPEGYSDPDPEEEHKKKKKRKKRRATEEGADQEPQDDEDEDDDDDDDEDVDVEEENEESAIEEEEGEEEEMGEEEGENMEEIIGMEPPPPSEPPPPAPEEDKATSPMENPE